MTKFTSDPSIPGDGAYDAGGDPNGRIAYYVCQAFNFTSPYQIALLLNRSYDGGLTWQHHGLVTVSTFNGNGGTKGSNGKFPDHENVHVDPTNGYVYVTWAEFSGLQGTHSPVYVAVSHDQGSSWILNKVTATHATSSDDGQSWRLARVTPAGFDPSVWGVPSSSATAFRPFIGDYNGQISTDTFAGITWTGFASPQPFNLESTTQRSLPS